MTPFFSQHPIWAMAFRPLYLLAAIYGALSIALWAGGYTGTHALPAQYWHAHEMIWGYAGAVVVAFLLTAVATWTGYLPVRGKSLMILVLLWIIARVAVFFDASMWLVAISGTGFYALAAVFLGIAIFKTKNHNNYIAVLALFLFALGHGVFHVHLQPFQAIELQNILISGLIMVSGFIGLIGSRIIPFFTANRLNTPPVRSPKWAMLSALILPMLMAMGLIFQMNFTYLVGGLGIVAGILGVVQSVRWFDKRVLPESMLWILHLGYLANGLGLAILGIAHIISPNYHAYTSLGVHLMAVGGIGLLTLGMMTRTALGHTGRNIYPAPQGLTLAFGLMVGAMILRGVSAILMNVNTTAYVHSYRLAAVLFVVSLLIYVWRYAPYLTKARIDGKQG